jgi:hypothetical protein
VDKRQWDNRCEYLVDDGTGLLRVNQWPQNERDAVMSNQFGIFQAGQPVTFHGKLNWYNETMRLILLGGRVENDADVDALSWLDIIVHDKDYRKAPSKAPQPCPRALASLNSTNRHLFASSAAPPVRTTAPVVSKFTAAAPTSTALAFMNPRMPAEPGEPLPTTRNDENEILDSANFVDEACIFGTSFEPLVAAGPVSGSLLSQLVPAFALQCVQVPFVTNDHHFQIVSHSHVNTSLQLLLQQDLPLFNSPNGFATADFTSQVQLRRETVGFFVKQHVPLSPLSQGVMCTEWLARCFEHLKSHGRVMAVMGDEGQTRWRFIDLRTDVEPKLLEFLRSRGAFFLHLFLCLVVFQS